jgi:predicted dehydrogenase
LATSLDEAAELVECARREPGLLVCAPHIVLSPTFRAVHEAVRGGAVGRLLTARARYGWAGPWWGEWFYRPGGGSLFDLGVYNVTSLCALFGPARRVTAMVGTAIPERVVNGRTIRVEADDNAHVLLDFGESRFAVVTTGFTLQKYRSPAIEVYGDEGTVQLLGDDWAPEGWELWRNEEGVWRVHPELDPHWPWTEGLRHLVDCVETGLPTVTRPEHAYHALEIMLAAQAAGRDGTARAIQSDFPELVYGETWAEAEAAHGAHDRRAHHGL